MTDKLRSSRAMAFYFLAFCAMFAVAFAKQVVLPIMDAIVAHDDAALAAALWDALWTFGLIALTVSGLAGLFIPGRLRTRNVRRALKAEKNVLVYTARFNLELKRALLASEIDGGSEHLQGFSFTLSATPGGVQFWTGLRNPHVFLEMPWSDVEEISAGCINAGGKDTSSICLVTDTPNGAPLRLTFAVGSEKHLGFLPRGKAEVERMASDLNDVKRSGTHLSRT